MNRLNLLVKGFLVGMGKIIPGVSGAVIAIMMGIYDRGIKAITIFFDNKKENLFFLFYVGIGIVGAIVFGSRVITYLMDKHQFVTYMFFMGLMFCSVISLRKDVKVDKKNILFILCGFVFSFILMNLNKTTHGNNNYIRYYIGGVLDAFATIFPGISGTALLMFYGVYDDVLGVLGNIGNVFLFKSNISILLPFFLGVVSGLVVFAVIINYLFSNYRDNVLSFIFGVVIFSIILFAKLTFSLSYNAYSLFFGVIMFIVGFIISYNLDSL